MQPRKLRGEYVVIVDSFAGFFVGPRCVLRSDIAQFLLVVGLIDSCFFLDTRADEIYF